jgi:hypothetical protein
MIRALAVAVILLLPLAGCAEDPAEPPAQSNIAASVPANSAEPLVEGSEEDVSNFAEVPSEDIPALEDARKQFDEEVSVEDLRKLLDTTLIRHGIAPSEEGYAELAGLVAALRAATEVDGVATVSETGVLRCMSRRFWPEGTQLSLTSDGCVVRLTRPSEFAQIPADQIRALERAAERFKGDFTEAQIRTAFDRVLIRHGVRLSEPAYTALARDVTAMRKAAEKKGQTDVSELTILNCLRMADIGPVATSLADAEKACAA